MLENLIDKLRGQDRNGDRKPREPEQLGPVGSYEALRALKPRLLRFRRDDRVLHFTCHFTGKSLAWFLKRMREKGWELQVK